MYKKSLMLRWLLLAMSVFTVPPLPSAKADLVIAEKGKTSYQIVLPDRPADEVVELWLSATAQLMRVAFEKNGFTVPVVREAQQHSDRPAIYLGATEFAKKNRLRTDYNDWSYTIKSIGQNIAIVGDDRKDPYKNIPGSKTPLALLGTVKGACDFLHQFLGVRFLFFNTKGAETNVIDGAGGLSIDTRSIAFLPVQRVAVPANLNLQKKPMMLAASDRDRETINHIALNFFPLLSFYESGAVQWREVITREKYGKTHPEYFALLPNGKRTSEAQDDQSGRNEVGEVALCPTNSGVQELMAQEVEKIIEKHGPTSQVLIFPLDSFLLSRCNDPGCNALFGMKAENYQAVMARGKTGKLWQVYFAIAKRVAEKYPEARLVVWDYQEHTLDAKVVQEFPPNVIPKLQFGSVHDFDRLKGINIPAGISGLEETFTGFGIDGRYAPERTPSYIAGIVRTMADNHMQWTTRDGGFVYGGLQAPAHYVFGRMMDDPSAEWQPLLREFIDSAFGNAAGDMAQFFELLHTQIAIYSDFYGVQMPAWNRTYARSAPHDNKWHHLNIYTPEFARQANKILTSAESKANNPDVKARLHLIRIELDYLTGLGKIYTLHDAWLLHPTPEYFNPLVDTIDEWHENLVRLSGENRDSTFKPLKDWPQMQPFHGHAYKHASLLERSYQQLWYKTCINWDTAAIRSGILTNSPVIKAQKVGTTPQINSPEWSKVSDGTLRKQGDMPLRTIKTTFKVLYDQENLYVRMDSLYPAIHPEDMAIPRSEEDVLKQEYVEIALRPGKDGSIYRFAANPTAGERYDAQYSQITGGKFTEDRSWNGPWELTYHVSGVKGEWSLPGRIWTTLFKIPFSTFGASSPKSGDTWKLNIGRHVISPYDSNEYLLWHDGTSAVDANSFGELHF